MRPFGLVSTMWSISTPTISMMRVTFYSSLCCSERVWPTSLWASDLFKTFCTFYFSEKVAATGFVGCQEFF